MQNKFNVGQKVKILLNDFTNTKITDKYAGKTFTIDRISEGNKGLHLQYFLKKDNGEVIKHPTKKSDYPFIDVELELSE